MISEKRVSMYCCGDFSEIENYEAAVKDTTQVWHCHHRNEIQGDKRYSRIDLMNMRLYWGRPPQEFIFLTEREHKRLHNKGKTVPRGTRDKISSKKKGCESKLKGVKISEKHRENISKGKLGHSVSNETRCKISKSLRGDNCPYAKGCEQLDKNSGSLIKVFKCIQTAADELGIDRSHIAHCCLGKRKTAGGYAWRYAS